MDTPPASTRNPSSECLTVDSRETSDEPQGGVHVVSTYVDGRMVYVRWTCNGQRRTGLVRIDAEDRHDFADASDCPVETDEEQEAIERACLAAFVAEPDDALDRWLKRETLTVRTFGDEWWRDLAAQVGGLH